MLVFLTLLLARSLAEECDSGNLILYSYVVEDSWSDQYTPTCDTAKKNAIAYLDDCTLPDVLAGALDTAIQQLEIMAPPQIRNQFSAPSMRGKSLKSGLLTAMYQVCKQVLEEIAQCEQNTPLYECKETYWDNYVEILTTGSTIANIFQNADVCTKVISNEQAVCDVFADNGCQWRSYPYDACRSSWALNSHEAVCNGNKDLKSYENLGHAGMTKEKCNKDEEHDFTGVETEEELAADGVSSHCTWDSDHGFCIPIASWKSASPSAGLLLAMLFPLLAGYKML